jgi:hypothetical protein
MFSDSDTSAMVAWFLKSETPTVAIRERWSHLFSDQWQAFYVLADAALKDQERWMEPHIAERRGILEEERARRGI